RGRVCLPAVGSADSTDAAPADGRDGESDGFDAGIETDDGADDATVDAPDPVLVVLDPGEASDVEDPARPTGVVAAPGQEYVLILWDGGLSFWQRHDVVVERREAGKAGPAGPRREPIVVPAAVPCLPGRFEFPGARRLADPGPRILADPLPGDTAVFRVVVAGGSDVAEVTARLEWIGPGVEFWADRTNPFPDPAPGFYSGIARLFGGIALPRQRFLLHDEPDVDGSGRITVLLSPTVGDLGAAGYVNPHDLITSPYGNGKDMIYLNPPPDWFDPGWRVEYAAGVLAHELQHLIRAGALGIDIAEAVYLNEGMSYLAADLSGFFHDVVPVLPGFLDDPGAYTVPLGIDSPSSIGVRDRRLDAVFRSGSYFVLRYLADRLGGIDVAADGTLADGGALAFLRSQYRTDLRGMAWLEAAVGASRRDFLPDWLTAMLLDGRGDASGNPLPLPPRHRFADPQTDPTTGAQRGVALNAANAYPGIGAVFLGNAVAADLDEFDGRIPSGGIEMLRVIPESDGPVVVRIEASPGAEIGARWVRMR
ncbi:MAG: hypothetical protein QME96_04865, partial [Myxococcota bacterium]|nr:hypothetical protein [Myxococcota bacterium]